MLHDLSNDLVSNQSTDSDNYHTSCTTRFDSLSHLNVNNVIIDLLLRPITVTSEKVLNGLL